MSNNTFTIQSILIAMFKNKHSQGDNYHCYQNKKKNWVVSYTNDYPLQHGDGVEWIIHEQIAEILADQFMKLAPHAIKEIKKRIKQLEKRQK